MESVCEDCGIPSNLDHDDAEKCNSQALAQTAGQAHEMKVKLKEALQKQFEKVCLEFPSPHPITDRRG